MISCNIAARLTELRTARGLTQGELAAALSISDKTVSKWENGASSPDLDMLIALAAFFDVSTDSLLGISVAEQSMEQRLIDELSALDRSTLPIKLFTLAQAAFPAAYRAVCKVEQSEAPCELPDPQSMPRCNVSTDDMFQFSVCSENVNFAVLQLRNRADFAWLTDADAQASIARLLSLLAQPDAMTLLHFLYSRHCSDAFTEVYVAKNTGLPVERCSVLLEELAELFVCHKTVAHRLTGEVTLYEFYGAGLLLSILSMAYEKTCGKHAYRYNYGGGGKMIGGEKV